jgi:hypothetical protein
MKMDICQDALILQNIDNQLFNNSSGDKSTNITRDLP